MSEQRDKTEQELVQLSLSYLTNVAAQDVLPLTTVQSQI